MNSHFACKDYPQVWHYRQRKYNFDEPGVVSVDTHTDMSQSEINLCCIITLNVFQFSKLEMYMAVWSPCQNWSIREGLKHTFYSQHPKLF